jgi:hypothetical protein
MRKERREGFIDTSEAGWWVRWTLLSGKTTTEMETGSEECQNELRLKESRAVQMVGLPGLKRLR